MKKAENVIGKTFNNLEVIEQISIKGDQTYCICKCLCGNEKIIKVAYADLKRGRTKSCGCIIKGINKKHGMTHTRIYGIWTNIRRKCYHSKEKYYKYYGERGIIVCDEWIDKDNGFMNFYNWAIENGYQDDLFLNRTNKYSNFTPDNCFWSKYIDNGNFNKNKMILITYNNETHNLAEWSNITGINAKTLSLRLQNNVDLNDIFLTKKELLAKTIENKHKNKKQDYYKPYDKNNNMIAEKNKSGIYKIVNVINDKVYIGSAINIYSRWKSHIQSLENNSHHSIYLQNSWNKYGGGNFRFEVIEYIDDKNLLIEKEQHHLDHYKSYDPMYGYNECSIAGSPLGTKHTEQTKIIMRDSHKKPVIQLEYKNNILKFVKRFDGIIEAEKELNIKSQNIIQCCKLTNRYYRAGGFIWMYEEDYYNEEKYNHIIERFNKFINSGKNKKAKELNVQIISEMDFNKLIGR